MSLVRELLATAMVAGIGICAAAEPGARAQTLEDARAILSDASHRAVGSNKRVIITYERTLQEVIGVQIRANDFDGALETLKYYKYEHGRHQILKQLANAMGAAGQLEAAFDVLSQHPDLRNHRSSLEDEIRLHRIDRMIVQSDLVAVTEQIAQLKSNSRRCDALQKLAAAHHKAGLADLATEEISLAINAAVELPRDMLMVAKTQLALGRIESAKETIERAIQTSQSSKWQIKVITLAQSAVIAARSNDLIMAKHLFEKAIENVADVNPYAIAEVAKYQAAAGYFDDALNTLSTSNPSKDSSGSTKDKAILAVAVAQFESGDSDAAFRSARLIQSYLQYRDDAFQKFAELQMAKKEFDNAVVSAGRIENGSIRATTLLKVAVELVNSGDAKTAATIADRIVLRSNGGVFGGEEFDFRDPQSWGRNYERGFTMASRHSSTERAAEVAAMAMTLSIKLGKPPIASFASDFKDFEPEVIRSLARAHAANGDANDALTWSKELPTTKANEAETESIQDWRQIRQIYALIGVADGILDRTFPQNR